MEDQRAFKVYFPEPTQPDTSVVEDEAPADWLRRSTVRRARSLRQALNENLNHLPPNVARAMARKLRSDWKSNYFELLVGRWLQELGATIEYEPLGTNNTRIDYVAHFPWASVGVEAISKRMNLGASMGEAYMDNSEQRIRLAWRDRDKRRQAAGCRHAALLAIDGGILAADVEDFDRALLGMSSQQMDLSHERIVGESFHAWRGEMLADDGTWAGVLAFVEPGVFSAPEPILYLSPHFDGYLPLEFFRVQRRLLAIRDYPASASPMSGLSFANPQWDDE